MTVVGDGALAADLRAVDALAGPDLAVLVPPIVARSGPFVELADGDLEEAWEVPLRWTVNALQQAFRAGATRIVLVVPAIAISGGRDHAAAAAAAEAVRATAKSAARQWGADGVTVNTVVVADAHFGIDGSVLDASTLAPQALAALGTDTDTAAAVAAVGAFAADTARHVTGQTVVADGGRLMP